MVVSSKVSGDCRISDESLLMHPKRTLHDRLWPECALTEVMVQDPYSETCTTSSLAINMMSLL